MVTINDVARVAKVSNATVSRVLHGSTYVSDDVRERVMTAVDQLGYQPSRVARSLRNQKSSILGVIITDVQNIFFTNLARAVEDVAYQNKYAVFLCNSDEDPEKERFYIDIMRAEHVAGVIISPTHETNSPVQSLLKANIPVVSVDRRLTDLAVDTVIADNLSGAFRLVSHLIEVHHQSRIAIITGPKDSTTGRERLEGYQMALLKAKIPAQESLIMTGSFKEDHGYRAATKLLEMKTPPTAIFAANNLLARGAIRAIHEHNLKIPEDIILVAFDQVEWGNLCSPSLTIMRQPSYDLGRISAELLFKRINLSSSPIQAIMLQPELSIGGSCGCTPSS